MRTEISPGQTSDYLGFDLVRADNLPEPGVLSADRGYEVTAFGKDGCAGCFGPDSDAQIPQNARRRRSLSVLSTQFGRAVLQQAHERPAGGNSL